MTNNHLETKISNKGLSFNEYIYCQNKLVYLKYLIKYFIIILL